MRTVLLGLLGLVLAVTVGLGVHLLTRDTISLPVVRLEPPLEAPATTTRDGTTTSGTTEEDRTEVETGVSTDDDNSGRGRGRSGGDGGGNSGPGGGDD
ncbi:MAG: hypothetical protein ACRDNB_06100 [Gaiellaceae bacterium]